MVFVFADIIAGVTSIRFIGFTTSIVCILCFMCQAKNYSVGEVLDRIAN